MFRTEDEVRERAKAYAGGAIASPSEAVRELWAAIHTLSGGEDLVGDGSTENDAELGTATGAPRRGAKVVEQIEPAGAAEARGVDDAGTRALGRTQEREAQGRENVGDQAAAQRDREAADAELERRRASLDDREARIAERERAGGQGGGNGTQP